MAVSDGVAPGALEPADADPVREAADDSAATAVPERAGGRRRRRVVAGWLMLAAGVAILVTAAWVGWRSYQAYGHLQTASSEVSALQEQLKNVTAFDPAQAAETVTRLQDETGAARSAVDDPVYRASTVLPFFGANLHALREVALTVDSLATDVMPSLVDVAQTLQPAQLAPRDGAIDLTPIERISPLLQDADAAVTRAADRMAAIDRGSLVQPVGEAVTSFEAKLDSAADVTGPAARIARLLPQMLGSEGPRTYLVVFQNPAELRATGGIFGSYALVNADHGKIIIKEQGASSRTLGFFDPPVATLTPNQIELYSELMAQYPMDVNFTPDYPTAARLFAEMYRLRKGTAVDGVLALDPVALSYTLKGAPPIAVGDGVNITSDNLVSILLSTAYEKFDSIRDQSQRDEFLANATATVFTDLMSGSGKPASIINGVRKAVGEGRVLLYSADVAEQADIATTKISGRVTADPLEPTIGVFMNDGTAAKLGYYLTNAVHVVEGDCRNDGRRELQVRISMTYDAPSTGLPQYVTGATKPGETYQLQTNVLLFAPSGGGVVGATRDGEAIDIGRGQDSLREVGTTTVVLEPGSTTELTFTVLGAAVPSGGPADVPPALEVTPGVNPVDASVGDYRTCTPGS